MRKLKMLTALTVALAVMLLPMSALAANEVFYFGLSNIKLTINDKEYEIGAGIDISLGLSDALDKAFGTAIVSVGDTMAASGVAAIENGALTAYVNGMQSYFTTAMDLKEMVAALSAELPPIEGLDMQNLTLSGIKQFVNTQVNSEATMQALTADPAAAMKSFTEPFEPYKKGEQEVSLDDGAFVFTGYAYEGTLTYEELRALIDSVLAANPGLAEAFATGFGMGMSAAGTSMSLEEFDAMVAENGMAIDTTFECLLCKEGYIKLDITVNVTEGEITTPVTCNMELGAYDPDWQYISVDAGIAGASSDDEAIALASIYADTYAEDGIKVGRVSFTFDAAGTSLAVDAYSEGDATYNNGTFSIAGSDDAGSDFDIELITSVLYDAENAGTSTGTIQASISAGGISAALSVDTAVSFAAMPEGELLTIADMTAVDPTTATEEEMQAYTTELYTVLGGVMAALNADPGFTALMNDLMAVEEVTTETSATATTAG